MVYTNGAKRSLFLSFRWGNILPAQSSLMELKLQGDDAMQSKAIRFNGWFVTINMSSGRIVASM